MDLRSHYEEKAAHARGHMEATLPPHDEASAFHQRLYREIIQAERAALLELWDQGQIDDEVLREMERELDLEELRLRVAE